MSDAFLESLASTGRFYARERLCSKYDIDRLFPAGAAGGNCSCTPHAAMAYPWRAVWLPASDPAVRWPRLLIVVPKRRLRHAVDRALMRRRLREAYRRNREALGAPGVGVDLALVYVASEPTSVDAALASLRKLFRKIPASLQS